MVGIPVGSALGKQSMLRMLGTGVKQWVLSMSNWQSRAIPITEMDIEGYVSGLVKGGIAVFWSRGGVKVVVDSSKPSRMRGNKLCGVLDPSFRCHFLALSCHCLFRIASGLPSVTLRDMKRPHDSCLEGCDMVEG